MSNDNPQGPGQDQPRWDSPPPVEPGAPGGDPRPPTPPPGGPTGGGQEPPTSDWGAPAPPTGGGNGRLIAYIIVGALMAICCAPYGSGFGIAAVILAAMALSKSGKGDLAGASQYEKIALIVLIVGFVVSAIGLVVTGAQTVDEIRELLETTTTTSFDF